MRFTKNALEKLPPVVKDTYYFDGEKGFAIRQ